MEKKHMLLIELWNLYNSKTMPVIGPGGVPLMCLQMLGGIPSLIGMYQSVHRESVGERVLLCARPALWSLRRLWWNRCCSARFWGMAFRG